MTIRLRMEGLVVVVNLQCQMAAMVAVVGVLLLIVVADDWSASSHSFHVLYDA